MQQHVKRADIDRRLAGGEPGKQVALDYGLNPSSVHRHRVNCLRLAALTGATTYLPFPNLFLSEVTNGNGLLTPRHGGRLPIDSGGSFQGVIQVARMVHNRS